MSVSAQPTLALARSFLFVPGHRPERFAKALASGAEAVIIDLEDAVPLDAKATARDALLAAWSGLDAAERARMLVRVNPPGTPWHEADLSAVARLSGLGALMLPKAEHPQQVEQAFRSSGVPVLPLIESAEGLGQMDAIARATGVLRLGLGHIDLQADLGMRCGPDEAELAPVRLALVVASRRAGLDATTSAMRSSSPHWLADELARSWRRQWPDLPGALEEAAGFIAPDAAGLSRLQAPMGVAAAPDDPIHPLAIAQQWVASAPRAALRTVTLQRLGADPAALGRACLDALSATG